MKVKLPGSVQDSHHSQSQSNSFHDNSKTDTSAAFQGMTNLQKKKLANKHKLQEMENQKQNDYYNKLYNLSKDLIEQKEKQKKTTKDNEVTKKQPPKLDS